MDAALDWLQKTALAVHIRDSLLLFPLLESTHVIGLAIVVGTVVIIDLRLLGLATTHRAFSRLGPRAPQRLASRRQVVVEHVPTSAVLPTVTAAVSRRGCGERPDIAASSRPTL